MKAAGYHLDQTSKQEEAEGNSSSKMEPSKQLITSSTSRVWLGMKDPRIVRVSRTFGGKDRHSKVRTIKGLRDRRVRLSVPTAVQLYDLQEKLGLAQPSKVVDWLLNAAQNEIDKLPALQLPQGINWNLDFPQSTTPFPNEIDQRTGNDLDEYQQHTWNLPKSKGFKRINEDDRYQADVQQIPNNGTAFMGSYFHQDPSYYGTLNLVGSNSLASATTSLSLQHENHHNEYRPSSLSLLVPNSQPSSFQFYGSSVASSSGSDHHHYHIATPSSSTPLSIPTMIFQGEPSSFLNISTQK